MRSGRVCILLLILLAVSCSRDGRAKEGPAPAGTPAVERVEGESFQPDALCFWGTDPRLGLLGMALWTGKLTLSLGEDGEFTGQAKAQQPDPAQSRIALFVYDEEGLPAGLEAGHVYWWKGGTQVVPIGTFDVKRDPQAAAQALGWGDRWSVSELLPFSGAVQEPLVEVDSLVRAPAGAFIENDEEGRIASVPAGTTAQVELRSETNTVSLSFSFARKVGSGYLFESADGLQCVFISRSDVVPLPLRPKSGAERPAAESQIIDLWSRQAGRMVRLLVKAAAQEQAEQKLKVIAALAAFPSRDARMGLERLAQDGDAKVKETAAEALGQWSAEWGELLGR